MSDGPQYKAQHYELQLPIPASFQDVRMWCFPLAARFSDLAEFVASCLNVPQGLRFEPVRTCLGQGIVYLRALDYPRMHVAQRPFRDWGFIRQRELLFAIPVRYESKGQRRIALFCPFVFVDDPLSVVTGNTVLGFPKIQATIRLPRWSFQSGPIELYAPVFPRHNPSSCMVQRPILRVGWGADWDSRRPADGTAAGTPRVPHGLDGGDVRLWPYGDVQGLFGSGGELALENDDLALFGKDDRLDQHAMVQLKQFREIDQPATACYQAIVRYQARLFGFHGAGPLPPAPIRLREYPGLRLRKTLGLGRGELRPILPFWLKLAYEVRDPAVLHAEARLVPKQPPAPSRPAAEKPRARRRSA